MEQSICPPKLNWNFNVCDDDIMVHAEVKDSINTDKEILNASVAGASISVKLSCVACKSSVEKTDEKKGKCTSTRCSMTQKLNKCFSCTTAKLMIESENSTMLGLLAYLPIIKQIIEKDDVTCDEDEMVALLLDASSFDLTYTSSNIINSVYRAENRLTV